MKILPILFFLMIMHVGFTQNSTGNATSNTVLFAQGKFTLDSLQIQEVESYFKVNKFVQLVRLDSYSNRFFIMTKGIEQLSKEELITWFGPFGTNIGCIQIGIHGMDRVNPFPFTECDN